MRSFRKEETLTGIEIELLKVILEHTDPNIRGGAPLMTHRELSEIIGNSHQYVCQRMHELERKGVIKRCYSISPEYMEKLQASA